MKSVTHKKYTPKEVLNFLTILLQTGTANDFTIEKYCKGFYHRKHTVNDFIREIH